MRFHPSVSFLLPTCAFDTIRMMDIEQLTKAQIVLLTLLVSFITSIATGIVTVSLMDQAPESVTQVINRVVERTVERVVPSDIQLAGAGAAGESVKEVTVVVKEDDLITDAIEKNSKSFVRISKKSDSRSQAEPGAFVGLGFFVRADGTVATDASLVTSRETYVITTHAGSHLTARVVSDEPEAAIALLQVETKASETFPAAVFADPASLKLGQTVISLSGEDRTSVAMGIVTDVETAVGEANAPTVARIRTDIADSRAGYGSPLFNMFGEMVGIHTAKTQTPGTASFTPLPSLAVLIADAGAAN